MASGTLKTSYSSLSSEKRSDNNVHVAPLVFGPRSSSRAGSKGSLEELSGGSLTPVFKRIHEHERKRSSLIPMDRGSLGSQTSNLTDEFSLPIARETRKVLGKGLPAEDPETLHYPDRVPSLIQMGQVLI